MHPHAFSSQNWHKKLRQLPGDRQEQQHVSVVKNERRNRQEGKKILNQSHGRFFLPSMHSLDSMQTASSMMSG
jgi:hypothetical protein